MNLDEKIARSTREILQQYLDLFQSSDDAGETLGYLKLLADQIPLLEDIKLEIKQLQNNLPQSDPEEEDPVDDPSNDTPTSDPDIPELRKRLRELNEGVDKTRRLLSPLRKALPNPDDPVPDWLKDIPWWDVADSVYKIWKMDRLLKEHNKTLMDDLRSWWNGDTNFQQFWKSQEEDSLKGLEELIDILNSDLEDGIWDLLHQGADLMSSIDDVFQLGQDMSQDMDNDFNIMKQCCQNLKDKVDDVAGDADYTAGEIPNIETNTDLIPLVQRAVDDVFTSVENSQDIIERIEDKVDTVDQVVDTINQGCSNVKLQTDKIPRVINDLNDIKSKIDNLPDPTQQLNDIQDQTDKIPSIKQTIESVSDKIDNLPDPTNRLDQIKSNTDKIPNVKQTVESIDLKIDQLPDPTNQLNSIQNQVNKIPSVKQTVENIDSKIDNLPDLTDDINQIKHDVSNLPSYIANGNQFIRGLL